MKVTWYPPVAGIVYVMGVLELHTHKYTENSGYFVMRDSRSGWNVARVDFDAADTEGDILLMMETVQAAAEIRLADYKEKHGVAV